ncbi:Zinc import ATP-binding protein ZnuC, partial [human gut metagenome]
SVEHNTRTALKYSTHILKLQNGSMKLYTKDEFIKYLEHENSISNII